MHECLYVCKLGVEYCSVIVRDKNNSVIAKQVEQWLSDIHNIYNTLSYHKSV